MQYIFVHQDVPFVIFLLHESLYIQSSLFELYLENIDEKNKI